LFAILYPIFLGYGRTTMKALFLFITFDLLQS